MKKVGFIEKLIPVYIPNRVVLSIFVILSFFTGKVRKKIVAFHLEENERILREGNNSIFDGQGFIENQSKWEKVCFGSHKKSNMSYSGCEIIATWNALMSMHAAMPRMPELIGYFERHGVTLKGGFGIAPSAPARYMKKRGYRVKRLTTRNSEAIRRFGDSYDSFLVTFYWDRENIRKQLHTVNISKKGDEFYVHNIYKREKGGRFVQSGPFRDLAEAIYKIDEKAAPLVIYGIAKEG
ncbi:hypothetical protein [Butyrivibrio sp. WCD3002]|uniref:hypothetical protein n=1 Tax=Butyrivibrio sp. WCD3002 TaxID=1280676 RepID=UPI00047C1D65|nr:hypothetical protein [Butyrivibrio sp. WCD3002]